VLTPDSILFFMSFVLTTTFFLIILLVSVRERPGGTGLLTRVQAIVDTFIPVRDQMSKDDIESERKTLLSTFVILDVHDCGYMTWDVFRLMLKVVDRSKPADPLMRARTERQTNNQSIVR
jgi:hypothetical protein